jgi:hypothetical protein
LLAVGLAGLAFFSYMTISSGYGAAVLTFRGEDTRATVVGEVGGKSERHRLRFETRSGRVVESDSLNSAAQAADVGDKVSVRYDSKDPQRVSDGGADLYLEPALWLALSVLLAFALVRFDFFEGVSG